MFLPIKFKLKKASFEIVNRGNLALLIDTYRHFRVKMKHFVREDWDDLFYSILNTFCEWKAQEIVRGQVRVTKEPP